MNAAEQLELDRFVQALNNQIRAHMSTGHTMAYGTVSAVSPLTVLLDGSATPAPCFRDASYSPTAGDRVYVHNIRNQNVVAGKLA